MPNRAHSRRDPQKGKNGFSTNKGFTVIELMIAVAVLAIVTSLALPSYRTIIEKRQVTSGAQQVGAFISAAQLEAVKRNENVSVSFTYTDETDWCIGMVIGNTGCDCTADTGTNTCKIDDTDRVLIPDNLNYSEAMVEYADGLFVIDPVRGMLDDFTAVTSFQFLSQPEETYALNTTIGPTGRVSICSITGHEVPGFESCP
jgi:prepilin-type N-terminal cleavage/methylation domain-containing protein